MDPPPLSESHALTPARFRQRSAITAGRCLFTYRELDEPQEVRLSGAGAEPSKHSLSDVLRLSLESDANQLRKRACLELPHQFTSADLDRTDAEAKLRSNRLF